MAYKRKGSPRASFPVLISLKHFFECTGTSKNILFKMHDKVALSTGHNIFNKVYFKLRIHCSADIKFHMGRGAHKDIQKFPLILTNKVKNYLLNRLHFCFIHESHIATEQITSISYNIVPGKSVC
jgi:hypothetical protein